MSLGYIGLMKSNGSPEGNAIAESFNQICRDSHDKKQLWITELRAVGIKAAHPDDGWVNRKINHIYFCYPHFNDGAKKGDLVALGWHFEKHRIVRLIDDHGHFEPWMPDIP